MHHYFRSLAFGLIVSTSLAAVSCGSKKDDPVVQPAAQTATLSGQISPAGSIVTVTATDASGKTTTATPGSTGAYSFSGLTPGTYTLTFTPASGYTAPAAASVTLAAGGTTAPPTTVAATPTTATLSGQISPAGSVTTVTATNASGTAVTTTPGSTGAYSFPNLPFGIYTLTFATAGGYQPITTATTVTLGAAGATAPTVSTSQLPTRASYTLNGVTITPVYISSQLLGSDRFVTFDTSTDQRITLFLQGPTPTVGTVSLTSSAVNYAQYNANDYVLYRSNVGSSSQGTLVITGVNTSARLYSGTFSFVGGVVNPNAGSVATKTITNGTFTNISY